MRCILGTMVLLLIALPGAAAGQYEVTELAKLARADGEAGDELGRCVALSGNMAVVGAPDDDYGFVDAGSAAIFRYDGDRWSADGRLYPGRPKSYLRFGCSVAADGDVVVVGAPVLGNGFAEVFRHDGTDWTREAKLEARDGGSGDNFGTTVAVDGRWILVGAGHDDPSGINSGSAYTFWFDGTTWVERDKLVASDGMAADYFGYRGADICDTWAIVGSWRADGFGSDSGKAYVFHYDGSHWLEQAILEASDRDVEDRFGRSVAIEKDHVRGNHLALVGAYGGDDLGEDSGAAYLFRYEGGGRWDEVEKLTAPDGDRFHQFGWSVALDGTSRATIGAPGDETGGAAHVFRYSIVHGWYHEQKLAASDRDYRDRLGSSVAVDWPFAVATAPMDDGETGAGYVFSTEPDLNLTSSPGTVRSGDVLTFETWFGEPGDPVGLVMVELDGRRMFQFVAFGTFTAPSFKWSLVNRVPPGLAGHEAWFQSFGVTLCDTIDESNLTRVTFR